MSRVLLWAPLGSIALLMVVFAVALLGPGRDAADPLRDEALPELPLETFDPAMPGFDPDAVEGPYLLNLWASWCAPCRIEHPVFMDLAERGIPIYGVVYKDDRADARAFLAELGNPFAGFAADPEGRAALELGVTGVPETFLIDGSGMVRARWRGAVSEPVWDRQFQPAWQAALEEDD